MFNYTITVSVEEGTSFSELKTTLLKNKKVKKVSKKTESGKVEEPMTEYYANGRQLSVKQFKARIAKAEADVKAGRVYTMEEMWDKHADWKKKHGLK